jgi:hypothetical protein
VGGAVLGSVLLLLFMVGQRLQRESGPPEVRFQLPAAGGEVSIFGRALLQGEGNYFLYIPYATPTPRFVVANKI